MSLGRYTRGAAGYLDVAEISDLDYIDRMIDYANDIHSLPESAAAPEDQEAKFGMDWDRPACACALYPYVHGGCLGRNAKRLPKDWQSGDDPKPQP